MILEGDIVAITKTDFIYYTRCPRYVKLDNLRKDKLSSNLSIEEYMKEEEDNKKRELLNNMFDEVDGEEVVIIDTIDLNDPLKLGGCIT